MAERQQELIRASGGRFEPHELVEAIDQLADMAHATSLVQGAWRGGKRNISEAVAVIHSELSAMLVAHRSGTANQSSERCRDITVAEEEFADVFIGLADLAFGMGIKLGVAIHHKMAFNRSRTSWL